MTRLFNPERHRPIEACAKCGQRWPCDGELARAETARHVAEAVGRATEAALATKGGQRPAGSRPFDEYSTPIRSGLTPAPEGTGQLNRDRAERLAEQLRGLQAARARAEAELRSYVARGGQP